MVGLTQLSAAVAFSGWTFKNMVSLGPIILSTILITAGGYIINDYLDLRIDRVNKPGKIILGKYISRKLGILIHIGLNAVALLLALSVSVKLFIIDLSMVLLLIKYSSTFKKQFLVGNIFISICCGSVFPILLFSDLHIPLQPLLSFGIFAGWLTLIREIIKDLEDLKGDKMNHCKTLAIVLGPSKTKKMLQWFIAIMLLLITGFSCYKFQQGAIVFPIFLMLFTGIPALYMTFQAGHLHTSKDFSKMSKQLKFTMLAGIISMWFYFI